MPRTELGAISLEWDLEGPDSGPVALLLMGLGLPRQAWPGAWRDALHATGFRTLAVDHRDAGGSTRLDSVGRPRLAAVAARRLLGFRPQVPYSLVDMARDHGALLDHLGIGTVHALGISMGGMVAQRLALLAPERVASLTLLATSSGRLGLPPPRLRVLRAAARRPRDAGSDPQAYLDWIDGFFRVIGSPAWPTPAGLVAARALEAGVASDRSGAGVQRQLAAILADADRWRALGRLAMPVSILHGEADPLIPPAHGRDLARLIRHAHFETIPGWGHDLPAALAPRIAARMTAKARRA